MSTDLAEALREFLAAQLPVGADPLIHGLHRSGTGSSRENWPFDAEWTSNGTRRGHELLLRRDPASAVVDTGRGLEFRLLRMLAATPVPVPEVHWLDETGEFLGRPSMIVGRRPGTAHRAVLRPTDPLGLAAQARVALARRICDVLADLHGVSVDGAGLPVPQHPPAVHELAHWLRELDRQQEEPQPALRLAASWLRDHLPPSPEHLVLVHGDFRPANVLVHDGQLDVLLDWELAHLGDPLDDLGWYTAPLYGREHFVPGTWEETDFLRRYTERTGTEVRPDALRFWQVLATFRLAVIALTAVRAFRTDGGDRPAAPADAVVRMVLAAIRAAEGD